LRKKVHLGDLARGCSELEMTWLLLRECTSESESSQYFSVFPRTDILSWHTQTSF